MNGSWRLSVSLGLLSASLVAYQLALMQVLSYLQWYHFAGMAIAVALLGFGAAATLLSLARRWLIVRSDALLPGLMLACAGAMGGSLLFAERLFGGFDTYLLFVDWQQTVYLLLTQLLLLLPFLLGALALGMAFVREVRAIGILYCANMVGSGLGGLLVLPLMWHFMPQQLPVLCALPAIVAGLLLIRRYRSTLVALAILIMVSLAITFVSVGTLRPSQYKSVTQALSLPDAKIDFQQASPYGLLQLLSAPALRSAPNLSLTFTGQVPVQPVLFNNGDWLGPLLVDASADFNRLQQYSLQALPYALGARGRVLVLQAGSGQGVALALAEQAQQVVAVEAHGELVELLDTGLLQSYWAQDKRVELIPVEPRTFLDLDQRHFDLISFPDVGSFGGNAGLQALSQQRLLTREAFLAAWQRLAPGGVLAVVCWIDDPLRSPLRLAVTLRRLLDDVGVAEPPKHMMVLRSWGTLAFVLGKSPFSAQQSQAGRDFAQRLQFDVLHIPGISPDRANRYHGAEPELQTRLVQLLLGHDAAMADNPFRWQPSTDNQPFFSQFLRWQDITRLRELLGQRSLPFLELGYMVQLLTLVQVSIAALLLILLPLLRMGGSTGGKSTLALYFAGLGIGYMFVEIALLHLLESYFGQPVFAAAGAIGFMLVFSGVGSLLSQRIQAPGRAAAWAVAIVALLILVLALSLPLLLAGTAGLPLVGKILVAAALTAPLALVMGFAFPLGLRQVDQQQSNQLAWAWGINGCLSVVATSLATVVAVEGGFRLVFMLAALCYLAAALAMRWQTAPGRYS